MNDNLNLMHLQELSAYILKCRSKFEEILELIIYSLVIFIILNALLFYLIHHTRNGRNKSRFRRCTKLPADASRVLLVTAHPDDECMFFGPTLIALRKRKECRIFVLCLSRGDFDKLGHVRKDELWNSCKVFKIKPQDITLTNCTLLPDNPNINWKVEIVSQLILNHVEMLDIDLLITFDKDGISQHKNHQAIYYATASLCLAGLMPSTCKVLILETVNILRKYLSLFDVVISLLLSTNWTILKWSERKIVQAAMHQHKSQMVWFRKLYIIFSRYMLINSLTELNQESIEFDILES
ncbi:CLUMA_CG009884, isoform A [Clunio marinus]|uniref:N-acetylglucosaminylphosphatidylinositol deacetylase n=1 Tax=Clunio marinus TaxID=568069 RepID=A0A1J1I8J5_9DIPT|nr:CLUMA_CG009884, isoform A [Clunio marinus]